MSDGRMGIGKDADIVPGLRKARGGEALHYPAEAFDD